MNKIWFSGIALASVMALVACGNGGTSSSNNGGNGGSSSNGGGGANGGGGTANGGGGGTGGSTSCFSCACDNLMSAGGCEDLCKMGVNGTTNPNFCDGASALSQCAACIASTCGESDPTACGM